MQRGKLLHQCDSTVYCSIIDSYMLMNNVVRVTVMPTVGVLQRIRPRCRLITRTGQCGLVDGFFEKDGLDITHAHA